MRRASAFPLTLVVWVLLSVVACRGEVYSGGFKVSGGYGGGYAVLEYRLEGSGVWTAGDSVKLDLRLGLVALEDASELRINVLRIYLEDYRGRLTPIHTVPVGSVFRKPGDEFRCTVVIHLAPMILDELGIRETKVCSAAVGLEPGDGYLVTPRGDVKIGGRDASSDPFPVTVLIPMVSLTGELELPEMLAVNKTYRTALKVYNRGDCEVYDLRPSAAVPEFILVYLEDKTVPVLKPGEAANFTLTIQPVKPGSAVIQVMATCRDAVGGSHQVALPLTVQAKLGVPEDLRAEYLRIIGEYDRLREEYDRLSEKVEELARQLAQTSHILGTAANVPILSIITLGASAVAAALTLKTVRKHSLLIKAMAQRIGQAAAAPAKPEEKPKKPTPATGASTPWWKPRAKTEQAEPSKPEHHTSPTTPP